MANAMLRDSPLPDTQRNDERLPKGSGSDKLLEEEGGEKLPEEAMRSCLKTPLQVNL